MADVTTALTTSLSTMITNATDLVTAILPSALGLIGLYFVIQKGIGFFKKVANKA